MAQTADPFQVWREWLTESERQWNTVLTEAMATEHFTGGMGSMMDMYLNGQKTLNETLGRYLSALNLPTRSDILDLGHRLSEIERRLDTIQTSIESRPSPGPSAAAAESPARPPRTRKPA